MICGKTLNRVFRYNNNIIVYSKGVKLNVKVSHEFYKWFSLI